MHKFVLECFNFLRNFLHFMKIVFVFCILMLLFYWVQNLTHANWGWLGFIAPFFDILLKISDSIYSVTYNLFGAVFEIKYLIALIILVALIYSMNLLMVLSHVLEDICISAHTVCKKVEENSLNRRLKAETVKEEKRISKYSVCIHTKIKKKFAHAELNINIDEQNKLMNEYIYAKLNVKPMIYDGGYLYQFNCFENIDSILDILFKVLNSNAPLDYAICIQAGEDLEQLTKLNKLNHYGKITMAADTAYRYRFNDSHNYETSQLGLFQNEDKTIEVHEFKQIL